MHLEHYWSCLRPSSLQQVHEVQSGLGVAMAEHDCRVVVMMCRSKSRRETYIVALALKGRRRHVGQ